LSTLTKKLPGVWPILDGSTGEYYFRTIKPVAYPGRTRHIHFAIKMKGREKWTTQCYVKGEALNERDGVFKEITDPKARTAVLVDSGRFKKLADRGTRGKVRYRDGDDAGA